MSDPNNKVEFLPVNIALLTVSDTRSLANDKSGDVLENKIRESGHNLVARLIVKDELETLVKQLQSWIMSPEIDTVIATGGTGLTGRDITPEAFAQVYEKEIHGFGELFRQLSYEIIGTSTLQSRASGGVSGGTYLFSLPGSPGACRDAWDNILKFQLDIRQKPCNLVELMPRLQEHIRSNNGQ